MAEQVRTAGGLVLLSGRKAGAPDVPARSPLIHIAIYSLLPGSEPPQRTHSLSGGVTFQQRQQFFCNGNRPLNNSLPIQCSGREIPNISSAVGDLGRFDGAGALENSWVFHGTGHARRNLFE
jgi:hypothetical protein